MNEETKIVGLPELKLQNVKQILDIFIDFLGRVCFWRGQTMTPPKEKAPDCLSIVGKAEVGKKHWCHKSHSEKRTKKTHSTIMMGKRARNHRLCQKITVKIVLALCCVASAPLLSSYQYDSVLLYILHLSCLLINSVLK